MPERSCAQSGAWVLEVMMIERVENIPAELKIHRLILHAEHRSCFRESEIVLPIIRTYDGVPLFIAVRIGRVGSERRRVEEMRHCAPTRRNAIWIFTRYDIGSISLS